MSMTIAPRLRTAYPRLPRRIKNATAATPQDDIDTTPVALEPADPALREAIIRFSQTLEPVNDLEIRVVCGGDVRHPTFITNAYFSGPMFVFTVGEASRVDPDTADPVTVFDRIQGELGVTQKELLAATGIRRRTYYSWKRPSTPRPRPSSLGRLWHLADALIDLREALDQRPIAAWLHSSPERLAAFKAGRFDDLVDFAVAMPKPALRAHGTSLHIGIIGDVDVPVVRSGRPAVTVVEQGRDGDD